MTRSPRRPRTLPRAAAAAAALALVSAAAAGQAQPLSFGLSPPEVELAPAPAGTATGIVVVYNRSGRRVRFRASVEDIAIRPSGTMDVLRPGSTAWSLASFTRVLPAEFDVDPDRALPVRVTVTVPPDARGGRYGAVVVAPTPVLQTTGVTGTVSVVVPKLASRLLVRVRGTELVSADIQSMVAVARPPGAEVRLLFRNTGNVHVRVQGFVVLLDASGHQTGKVVLPDVVVLPGGAREFRATWATPLTPGAYTVRAVLDYGGAALLAGETGLQVRGP
ncbi:MAG: hypothetical protein QN173_09650 [Armatimonadota bacterium]|nr:hypothetical protein [Armatimonadota bacterium]MDR7437655.1 hypothetical protein [Armatimonadota bacterium]MDR7471659.1 hypothetical protein [Armatimonadota bacterium]MDR7507853.1 hypothetical protein [Armatimonadota bacterium]MDR7509817.1 hypothetical protein [Armatimonadota bacterium]